MDEPPHLEVLLAHEVVGRRLRDDPSNPVVDVRDGGVRVLVGAFKESRVDAHISVDRFWVGDVGAGSRMAKIRELAAICVVEGWQPMKGWACARVDAYSKAWGVRTAVASPKPGVNPHHADLVKADWLVVRDGDSGRDKREKAHQLAQALADYFNSLLEQDRSEFVQYPDADA